MFGCFFCTKCGCYQDKDELTYYRSNEGRNMRLGQTTEINGDDSDEDRTVAGAEKKAKMALAGPKLDI